MSSITDNPYLSLFLSVPLSLSLYSEFQSKEREKEGELLPRGGWTQTILISGHKYRKGAKKPPAILSKGAEPPEVQW